MKKLIQLFEQVFTVLSLLMYSGGVVLLVISGGAGQSDVQVTYDTSLIRAIYLLIYIITALLLVLRWQRTIRVFFKGISVWFLVLAAIFSVVWSFNLSSTLKDGFTLVGSSLFGLYLASRYTWRQQLQLLGWMFGLAVVLSFFFALALPQYGIAREIGSRAWRGIYIHKNGLGGSMAMSTIVFALLAIDSRKNRWILLIFFCLSAILLALAQSISALMNLFLLIVVALFAKITTKWRDEVAVLGLSLVTVFLGALSILLTANAANIFGLFGKDLTLTGRTSIWAASLEMINQKLFLGYGFGGFWHGLNGESAYIWRTTGWTPTHPHNGFIALCLDVGLLGLFLFVLTLLNNLSKALSALRSTSGIIESTWAFTFLSYFILVNLTETALLRSNSFLWILYVTVTGSLQIPLMYHLPKQRSQNFQSFKASETG